MRVQINKEGRTQYARQYFFPGYKDKWIRTDVHFENAPLKYWGDFTVAEILYDTLSIVFYCPHCGLQMYGAWYRHEKFIAKRAGHEDGSCEFKSWYYLPEYQMTFGKLWEAEEKENKAYAPISRRIEKEISAVRAMETCPICGEKLSEKRERENSSPEYLLDFDFSFRILIENYDKYPHVRSDKTIQAIQSSALCQDIDIDRTKLSDNPNLLQKYIKHLLDTEMTVRFLEKRLHSLDHSRYFYRRDYIRELAEEMSVIAKDQYHKTNVAEPTINDVVLDDVMPIEPRFAESVPVEPEYQKPGLFNKKKVQAQNEQLRLNYEADYQAFQLRLAEHEKNLNAYHSAMDLYNKKKQEAFACRLKKHREKMEENRKSFVDEIDRRKAEITEQLGTYVLYQETSKEIQLTEELYAQSYACLQSLYSCGVVYEKYRNPVALASFYDYLAAGRCTTLTGADGAYNIYENEIRLDRIVTKLDVVIKQLEQIKDNQYALYSEMSKMNANLEALNSTARTMNESMYSIKDYQKNISDNTAIIAHNTAVTAFYAKKNAELTNALGFMVALK